MTERLLKDEACLRSAFDAFPSSAFIIDAGLRVWDANREAARLSGMEPDVMIKRLCGEVLHCLHENHAQGGCGTTRFCPDCTIRNSVLKAVNGNTVHRQKAELIIQTGGNALNAVMLVTASPFLLGQTSYALLILEDMTELFELRSILPICSHCKKVRSDKEYWESVEGYFKRHVGVQFSHSICPTCMEMFYPDDDE